MPRKFQAPLSLKPEVRMRQMVNYPEVVDPLVAKQENGLVHQLDEAAAQRRRPRRR